MMDGRKKRNWVATTLILGGLLAVATCGCVAGQEFRAAAGDSLRSGLTTVTNGLIDGLFAVFEPDTTTSSP